MTGHLQIGEVAERTGLSLRTIRYYGEVGLVTSSSRSEGGFRLYTDGDVDRLHVVKRMKSLDFSIDEMRHVLTVLDTVGSVPTAGPERDARVRDLEEIRVAAEKRRAALRARLAAAEAFVADLDDRIVRLPAPGTTTQDP